MFRYALERIRGKHCTFAQITDEEVLPRVLPNEAEVVILNVVYVCGGEIRHRMML